ncbi:MAG: hypothetical protein WCF15_07950, partial [Pseudolabrys sp.]
QDHRDDPAKNSFHHRLGPPLPVPVVGKAVGTKRHQSGVEASMALYAVRGTSPWQTTASRSLDGPPN